MHSPLPQERNNVIYLKNYSVKVRRLKTKNVQEEIIFNSRHKSLKTEHNQMSQGKPEIEQLRKMVLLKPYFRAKNFFYSIKNVQILVVWKLNSLIQKNY